MCFCSSSNLCADEISRRLWKEHCEDWNSWNLKPTFFANCAAQNQSTYFALCSRFPERTPKPDQLHDYAIAFLFLWIYGFSHTVLWFMFGLIPIEQSGILNGFDCCFSQLQTVSRRFAGSRADTGIKLQTEATNVNLFSRHCQDDSSVGRLHIDQNFRFADSLANISYSSISFQMKTSDFSISPQLNIPKLQSSIKTRLHIVWFS